MNKSSALTLILVSWISNTIAIPTFWNRDFNFPSCGTISYYLRTTGTRPAAMRGQRLNPSICTNLSVKNKPTTIDLIDREDGCLYKVRAFSDSNCRDDREVGHWALNSGNPVVTLNRRKPICSYYLKYNPFRPVRVITSGGNGPVNNLHHYSPYSGSRCFDLCSSSSEFNYPNWIGVFNERNEMVNQNVNYIELFSQPRCQGRLMYRDGKTAVTYESYLDKLTKYDGQPIVGSFRIDRARRH